MSSSADSKLPSVEVFLRKMDKSCIGHRVTMFKILQRHDMCDAKTNAPIMPKLAKETLMRDNKYDQPFVFRFIPGFTSDGNTSISQVFLSVIVLAAVALTSIASSIPDSFLIVPAFVTFVIVSAIAANLANNGRFLKQEVGDGIAYGVKSSCDNFAYSHGTALSQ